MLNGSYATLYNRLLRTIPEDRLIHDDLRTLAFGTDASFYRLIPKLVVKIEEEAEVVALLREAGSLHLPVTFRAAGTSLSGQAISDSVLAVLGRSWKKHAIIENGSKIVLQPGVIGGHANVYLAQYDRKIGPDPASINACMIGGIVANNASGMCCGTAQNTYRTLHSMRIVFQDGSVLDTSQPSGRTGFASTHSGLLQRVSDLAARVRSTPALAERIRRKYKMKNTTGFSLNALVDFDDPFEIIQHLMVGSEGTLGFISEVTLHTVPELRHKATALILFPDIKTACEAVTILKASSLVEAVELMDRASLRSVEGQDGMPSYLRDLDEDAAALLVEARAREAPALVQNIRSIKSALASLATVRPVEFTDDAAEYTKLWNIRKGLFPSVGAMRRTGTTVIIEDVAFPVSSLAEATLDLQELFRRHGYRDAIIFGHALEGNLHFVFSQDFNAPAEVERYKRFLDDVAAMVVEKYDGSLKAEHGTGRNMAPFVEMEWGSEAYALMKEIKNIFDPENLLNPGVIINQDPLAHLKDLKPLPAAHEIVDKCIECGFCEVQCPSKDLTLTPRQRIVAYREISRLRATGENPDRLSAIEEDFSYYGDATCATDGLCALTCPVHINTGDLVKKLRMEHVSPFAAWTAWIIASNMKGTVWSMRWLMNLIDAIHGLLGTPAMESLTRMARRLSANKLPFWNAQMPRGADRIPRLPVNDANPLKVVYFPTCINRSFGVARASRERRSLATVTVSLLRKAGYEVLIPENVGHLCCGMAFASKGFTAQGKRKARELEDALSAASLNGGYPILVDMSPCLLRMKETLQEPLKIFDQVDFVLNFLTNRLEFRRLPETIAIHPTCSTTKLGLDSGMVTLAKMCAENVVVPHGIGCCGWAGDRGFTYPELNASALNGLREKIPSGCHHGYSNSRTCEIGLSLHSGITYQSILYLVDEVTTGK